MNRIMRVVVHQGLAVVGAVIFTITTPAAHSEEASDALIQRNQALQRQYSRASEVLRLRNTQATTLSGQSAARTMMVPQGKTLTHSNSSVSFGLIQLSKDATLNQQLNQGMNDARMNLEAIKASQPGSEVQEQQRGLALAALDQTVYAYLGCRAENYVPINAHYEQDPFLKQMIVIRQRLMKEKLQDAAVSSMLDRLSLARSRLVELTEKLQ